MEEQYVFQYGDGEKTRVQWELASRQFKYIRIFNLPPETDDKDITAVLGQFGRIRQHVRERYPAEYGYQVFSGIRGVHMEIEKEIPANLYIGHFRARLYYEGLKNKCFFCKAEGHIKAECPKLASLKENSNDSLLYSRVTANLKVATRLDNAEDASLSSMTILQVPKTRGRSGVEVVDSNATNTTKELASMATTSNDQREKEKVDSATPTITNKDQNDAATPTVVIEADDDTHQAAMFADDDGGTQQAAMLTDNDGDACGKGNPQLKRPPGTASDSSDLESGAGKGRGGKKQHIEQAQNVRDKIVTRSNSKA